MASELAKILAMGDPEAAGAMDASNAMSPAVSALAKTLAGNGLQNFYDPNRSFAQNALDPRGIEQAMNIGAGFAMPIKAYHGSPYDFAKFDASKIGTGEGAQAYGHGLYFAESPQVARNYRDNLSNPVNKRIDPNSLDPQDIAVAFYRSAGQRAGASHAERMALDHPDQADAYLRAAEIIRSGDPYAGVSPGKMYEVNINAEPDQFLNWDKPLSEQSAGVQGALSPYRDLLTLRDPATGLPAPEYGEPIGAEVYRKISDKLGVPQGPNDLGGWRVGGPATSSDLSQRGIPGIRYLDQGSRGSGQGTSNYVVFDPSIVDITKKYGLAALLAGAGVTGTDDANSR